MMSTIEQQYRRAAPLAGGGEAGDSTLSSTASTRQYVTFIVGSEVYAVALAPVQEIIRVPSVVRVPLAPDALDGLSNLRGKILPIVSLRRIFQCEERASDEASRALVIDLGHPLGFVVDRVTSVVNIDVANIESVEAIRETINSDLLSGIIKNIGNHPMIMILDFAKLIARQFAHLAAGVRRAETGATSSAMGETGQQATSDELQLVSFDVAGQEYAIAIDDVQEIVQFPEQIVQVPHAQSHVLGVMTLRQRLLPLVSLRHMFALAPQQPGEQSRIVVLSVGTASVGVVTDSVNEVLRVGKEKIEPIPALLARDGDFADISAICRLDDGHRLVSIIDAAKLFHHSSVKEALNIMQSETATEQTAGQPETDELDGDDEQMVIFRLDMEEFGVPIGSVQEIVRVPEELTHVPKAPPFVEGVINLRGAVLPVVDLRRRLDLPVLERCDRQRVMVFLLGGMRTGFIVDSVAEVLKIARSAIEPAPPLSSQEGKLLARMANLQQRMVQLLDPAHLIDYAGMAELADLEQLAGLAPPTATAE